MTTPSAPGWYDDPHSPDALRYFNGESWTPQRKRKPPTEHAPSPAPLSPQYAPPIAPPSPQLPPPQYNAPPTAYPPPPAPPAAPPIYGQPTQGINFPPPTGVPYPSNGYPGASSETNQFAIWSLVCSLAGILVPFGSIVGLVLGIIALNQIKMSGEQGKGMATAGIAVGGAVTGLGLLVFSML